MCSKHKRDPAIGRRLELGCWCLLVEKKSGGAMMVRKSISSGAVGHTNNVDDQHIVQYLVDDTKIALSHPVIV